MRASTDTPHRDRPLLAFVAARHGIADRAELVGLGFDRSAIARRVRSGRLYRLHPAVYSVSPSVTREGRYLAAVKAGGAGAVLSHRSAAALWDLASDGSARPAITVHFTSGVRSNARLRVHRTRRPIEATIREGIAVTTLARTLADLAEILPRRALEKALERAHALHLLDVRAIEAVAEAHPGRHGPALVRHLVRAHDLETTTRSGLEDAFLELCDRYGIPRPVVNARIHGMEVDCCWPDAGLIVELDGYGWHRHRAAFRADRAKSRRLMAVGWSVARIAGDEIADEPARVAAEIRALRASRRPARDALQYAAAVEARPRGLPSPGWTRYHPLPARGHAPTASYGGVPSTEAQRSLKTQQHAHRSGCPSEVAGTDTRIDVRPGSSMPPAP
jgi:Transcriptional regulator, AbiEi antitoxin/Protein of unknown function (DUF559)